MKLEHVAFNVSDPHAIADWYVNHLGFRLARKNNVPPFVTFIADDSGKVMLEFCNDPLAEFVPDYANMNTLLLHIALVSDEPHADQARLVNAGATFVSERKLDNGSLLIMLRDPWGLALQLCKRNSPLLSE